MEGVCTGTSPPGVHPLDERQTVVATEAGGTHPTGMHSCLQRVSVSD